MFDHQSCIIKHGELDEAMHEGRGGFTYRKAAVAIHVEQKQRRFGSHAVVLQVTMVREKDEESDSKSAAQRGIAIKTQRLIGHQRTASAAASNEGESIVSSSSQGATQVNIAAEAVDAHAVRRGEMGGGGRAG